MNFDFLVDFSLTYYLLTVASFRIGVPPILLLVKKLEIEKTKNTFLISVLKVVSFLTEQTLITIMLKIYDF